MSDLRLGGLATGLDADTIIGQLLALERQPRVRLAQQESVVKARQTALRDITARLGNLKTAAADLRSATLFADTQSVDSSDPTKLAATRTSGTGPGSYQVTILQTAVAAQRTYTYAPSASATTLDVGGRSTQIAANATLDEVVSAINGDGAAAVYAANVGGQLVLSSRTTGAAGFTAGGTIGLAEDAAKAKAGRDAQYQLDGGATQTSSSNSITSAVPGLTLTLKATGTATVTVGAPGPDIAGIVAKVKAFVEQYNSTVDFLRSKVTEERVKEPKTDAERALGALRGDTMLQGVLRQLRSAISEPVAGNPSTLDELAEIGVSTGAPSGSATFSQDAVAGKLVLDEAKLTAALTSNAAGVRQLLGGVTGIDGFAQRVEAIIDPLTKANGSIEARLGSADTEIRRLEDGMARVDQRVALRERTLRAQFTALEVATARSQSLQQALGAQLAALG